MCVVACELFIKNPDSHPMMKLTVAFLFVFVLGGAIVLYTVYRFARSVIEEALVRHRRTQ